MCFDDLRQFLAALDAAGQLLRISEAVMPEPDLAAAACAAPRLGDTAPGLLFSNVIGFEDARIALNLHGSWANHAIALGLPAGTPVKEQVDVLANRWGDFPVPVERRTDAPFMDNTVDGDAVDLFRVLPLFRLNDGDGGFFIDKASVISRDLDDPTSFGKQNVGIYRLQVKDRTLLGLQPVPQHDIAIHLRIAEERGEDLPVAIAIGNEPVISIVASTPLAYDQSEYEMAGAIRGESYPVTSGPLTGLDVPYGSEILLEGVVLGRERQIEGPFGEFTGHYSGGRAMPIVRIDRISYRAQPIFEQLYLGMPWTELEYLIGPNTCISVRMQLKAEFPEVEAVNAMYTHGLLTIISLRPRYGGFAKAVGMRAMSTPHGLGYCKVVILVDAEVDPFNLPQVMWAVSTKVNPRDDVMVLPNLSVVPLDPAADPQGMTSKLIVDATTPVPPDNRGHFDMSVRAPVGTDVWLVRLTNLLQQQRKARS